MTVTVAVYTNYKTYVGTLAEVVQQLSNENVPDHTIVGFFYDVGASKVNAVVKI